MNFLIWLESLRFPALDAFMSLITHLGEETFFILGALVVFWCWDKYRGYYLLYTGLCGTVINQFLKIIFRIPRPWVLDGEFQIVESARAEATGYSFPSGHTQSATTLYGGFARLVKQNWLRVFGIVLVCLIAFSRMYLGVHTPKDVFVSLLIGAALVIFIYPLVEKGRSDCRYMYILLGSGVVLSLVYLLYVCVYPFPSDVDAANLLSARNNGWKLFGCMLGAMLTYIADVNWTKFDSKAVWWAQILKVALGLGIVMAIRLLLKAPLNALCGVLIGSGVRYFLIVVFAGVIWPLTFTFFAKLGNKKPRRRNEEKC